MCAATAACPEPAQWVALPCRHSVCTECCEALKLVDRPVCGSCNSAIVRFDKDVALECSVVCEPCKKDGQTLPSAGKCSACDVSVCKADAQRHKEWGHVVVMFPEQSGAWCDVPAQQSRLRSALELTKQVPDLMAKAEEQLALECVKALETGLVSIRDAEKQLREAERDLRKLVEDHRNCTVKELRATAEASHVLQGQMESLLVWSDAVCAEAPVPDRPGLSAVANRLSGVKVVDTARVLRRCNHIWAVAEFSVHVTAKPQLFVGEPLQHQALLKARLETMTSLACHPARDEFFGVIACDGQLWGTPHVHLETFDPLRTGPCLLICRFKRGGTDHYLALVVDPSTRRISTVVHPSIGLQRRKMPASDVTFRVRQGNSLVFLSITGLSESPARYSWGKSTVLEIEKDAVDGSCKLWLPKTTWTATSDDRKPASSQFTVVSHEVFSLRLL